MGCALSDWPERQYFTTIADGVCPRQLEGKTMNEFTREELTMIASKQLVVRGCIRYPYTEAEKKLLRKVDAVVEILIWCGDYLVGKAHFTTYRYCSMLPPLEKKDAYLIEYYPVSPRPHFFTDSRHTGTESWWGGGGGLWYINQPVVLCQELTRGKWTTIPVSNPFILGHLCRFSVMLSKSIRSSLDDVCWRRLEALILKANREVAKVMGIQIPGDCHGLVINEYIPAHIC